MKRRNIIVGLGLLGVCGLCGIVALGMAGGGDDGVAKAPAVQTEAAGGATAPPAPTTAPWPDIKAFREKATDAQWEAYVKSNVIGSRLTDWRGYVYEVRELSGKYSVSVDLEDPSTEILASPELRLKTDDAAALNWFKGTPVRVSGTVKDASYGMGIISSVELEDATIATE